MIIFAGISIMFGLLGLGHNIHKGLIKLAEAIKEKNT